MEDGNPLSSIFHPRTLLMVKVKVCGITNVADAEKALEFGADLLGFNFYSPSPRALAPAAARAIIESLPRETGNIALFVNEPKDQVEGVLALSKLAGGRQAYSGLQFHGEETREYCRGWSLTVIKAFRMREEKSLDAIVDFPADYYLFDSWSRGYGGSGSSFPWEWLEGLPAEKVILSGGLNIDNVGEAIRRVGPYGVDVCSGVEARPGIKDHAKLKEFILAAKGA
jgi:phosphoribosylanthranilate isomerase